MRKSQKSWFTNIGVAVSVGLLLLLLVSNVSMSGSDEASLYQRIGGQTGVTTVVDNFLANVVDDNQINIRFANADMGKLRQLLIDQVCEATGGPCTYKGKTMLDAHKGMGVTKEEFESIAAHFSSAMVKASVDAQDQATIMGVLAGMYDDIVGH